MATFLTQIRFTDAGLKALSHSPERAAAFRQAVEKAGGKMIGQYWAMGECDGVGLFSAPSDEIAANLLLGLTLQGFVRTTTMRLLDEDEFRRALTVKS
jgi:uncharacterized protein with GYD domain